MILSVEVKYEIGQIVYLKTDKDQLARIVISYMVTRYETKYLLSVATNSDWHNDFEISDTKDVLAALA